MDAVKLITYNIWANRLLTEQVAQLPHQLFIKDVGGSFPSLQKTLRHVLESDWIWMHRWKGVPLVDVPGDWQTNDAPALLQLWTPIQNEMKTLVTEKAAQSEEELAFTTRSGVALRMAFIDTLLHVTNHGTYHRGQLATLLRMLGEKPTSTDYFIFCTQK